MTAEEPVPRRTVLKAGLVVVTAAGVVSIAKALQADPATEPSATVGPGTTRLSGAASFPRLDIAPDATIEFDPASDTVVEVAGHVIVEGTLRMRPDPGITHVLRFVDVDESRFAGGPTMEPVDSDTGLWVMGGTLDVAGTRKRGWTRLDGAAQQGDRSLAVRDAGGWLAGDVVVVAPTENPAAASKHYERFDRITIESVSGNTVTLAEPLAHSHPTCTTPDGTVWTAEVLNLTRNVRIEGTPDGRPHLFVHGGRVASFSHVELAHLGPRKKAGSATEEVPGRYGLHFHHAGDATRGLTVDGVVCHDLGGRAFVPHASHGITFTDCAVWDCFESGFFWDTDGDTDQSHDISYDRCAVGRVRSDPPFRGYSLTGFLLVAGQRPVIRDCAAFGILGNSRAAGYTWPASVNHLEDNVWTFERNVAHNNKVLGAFVWQNDTNPHVVDDLTTYRCGSAGLLHGAYANAYHYVRYVSAEHGTGVDLSLHAASRNQQGFTGGHIGRLVIERHNLPPSTTGEFRDVQMGGITVNESDSDEPGRWNFIDCGLAPGDVTVDDMHPQSVLRVQTDGRAWTITASGVEAIPPFA